MNKSRKNNTLAHISALALLFFASTAQSGKEDWFDKGGWPDDSGSVFSEYGLSSDDISYRLVTMQSHLNLTDTQFASLRDIFTRYDKEFSALMTEKQAYEAELGKLLEKGNLDKDVLEREATKLGDVTKRMAILRVTNRAEMYDALDQTQRKKFRDYWQHGKGRKGDTDGQGSNW